MKNEVSVAVTGIAWMGSGIGSIETAMESLFREAKNEILITSYSISSAADIVLDWLGASLSRGVVVRFAINKLNKQPKSVIDRLLTFNQKFPHFYLYAFQGSENEDLHAKVIVADRCVSIVGSSNLSYRGLLTNHELAVVTKGQGAEMIANALHKMFAGQYLTQITK